MSATYKVELVMRVSRPGGEVISERTLGDVQADTHEGITAGVGQLLTKLAEVWEDATVEERKRAQDTAGS